MQGGLRAPEEGAAEKRENERQKEGRLHEPAVLQTFRLEEANRVHELIDNMKLPGRSAFLFD